MTRFAKFLVMLAGVTVLASPAFARDPMPMMHSMPMGDIESMTRPPMSGSCPTPELLLQNREAIGLSSQQVNDLISLDYSLRRKKITMGARVKALEIELTEIVTDPGFDEGNALDKLREIEKARTELRSEVIKASAKAREFLDAGQLEKLREVFVSGYLDGTGRPGPAPAIQSKEDDKSAIKERMMREMMQKNMP